MGIPSEDWANAVSVQISPVEPAYRQRERFLSSLPPGYVEETHPGDAADDWLGIWRLLSPVLDPETRLGHLGDDSSLRSGVPGGEASLLALRPSRGGAPGDFRLRRRGRRRVELSSMLAVLETFGLAAVEAVPWHFVLGTDGPEAYVDDIGLRVTTPMIGPGPGSSQFADRLVAAIEAVLDGHAELNILNRLVVGAGLGWQEVNLLCAYCSFRQVVGGPRAADRAESLRDALVAFPATAVSVVGLFRARLAPTTVDPSRAVGAGGPTPERSALEGPALEGPAREGATDEVVAEAEILGSLSQVPDLSHYDALREVVSLVSATTRSNWPVDRSALALKFASAAVPFLPSPRPMAEVFVWSPNFEGLHLRFGRVARGGVRWSDRRSDVRAEVLGLAQAQVKKNSLIIPTGAKGAFVLRPDAGAKAGGKDAYCAFIRALLELTDNIVDGKVVHPEGIRCRDGGDPYLVVAPDKGTASFSDLANTISAERGFWLGDAFASGGSHGYDHKALGITARGAWRSVRRHFRALGMDDQRDELRVVGVGDMSGDVFGNGMLQSRALRLVAAFDHRHIFIDPSPRPEGTFEERLRLSRLPGSSWADFDLAVASPGAAVFSRQAKQVELSPQACATLGTSPGPMSPPDLVKAVLRAPVDLIFFGGIGTYVRALGESDAEVDDSDNDDVRVSAEQLRARVVVEGANLAVTQRARASYSRRGGRVNADFVDNAAGVAMSDREVNLKILLSLATAGGRLDAPGRDAVLAEAQDAAAAAVLAQVEASLVALDGAALSSAVDFPAYEALMEDLESSGLIDRDVEALPADEELSRRRDAGAGLSRPELAVLLAYARSAVARSIEGSELVLDPALRACAMNYFPASMRERFADLVPDHPLFAQLLASQLANEVVHRMGAVWANEVTTETGRPLWEVAGAYWAASQVLGAEGFGVEVDGLAPSLGLDSEFGLRSVMASALDKLARWYLRRQPPSRPVDVIERDQPLCLALGRQLATAASGPAAAELAGVGVPADAAARADALVVLAGVGEVADVARSTGRPLGTALDAHRAVEAELALPWLTETLRGWPAPDRWQRWELHSLADDIAYIRVAAATQALESFPGAEGREAARQWLESRRAGADRAASLLGQLGRSSPPNLPLATVVVRALADLVGERPSGRWTNEKTPVGLG